MGEKGSTLSAAAAAAAELVVERLSGIGEVSSRKMFGGYGIFESGRMFGIINSGGQLFFKVDESNRTAYEGHQAERHGKMPYYAVPQDVLENDASLSEWAALSVAAAANSPKK